MAYTSRRQIMLECTTHGVPKKKQRQKKSAKEKNATHVSSTTKTNQDLREKKTQKRGADLTGTTFARSFLSLFFSPASLSLSLAKETPRIPPVRLPICLLAVLSLPLTVWMPKIRRLVLMSGNGNSILRSILPGRMSAGSSDSILFVAMITCLFRQENAAKTKARSEY